MHEIYLDNSATTKMCESAVKVMVDTINNNYGNPSSLHTKGFEAERILETSRKNISKFIVCEKDEIYFTSGGTEANNLAIMGTMSKVRDKDKYNVVTTSMEHPSVLNTFKKLEKDGFEVRYISPDSSGEISIEKFQEAIDENTKLVSCMMVNNEIGCVYPVQSIKKVIKQKKSDALLHIDAVQAFGKIPINVKKWQIDLLSASAHKIHGPKGIGFLYVNKNVKINPVVFGGGQEKGLRSGTQAVPLIAAFSEAVNELSNYKDTYIKIKELNEYCRNLLSSIDRVYINSNNNCLPYVLNFSVKGIRAETILHYLSSKGIYVSSGSACSKGHQSYVLKAMGLSDDLINSSIRVSFCRSNTKEDVEKLVLEINNAIDNLIKV